MDRLATQPHSRGCSSGFNPKSQRDGPMSAHCAGNPCTESRIRPVGPTIRHHSQTDCTSLAISKTPAKRPNNITMYGGGYHRTVGPSGLICVVFVTYLARWARLFEWMDLWSGRSKKCGRSSPSSVPTVSVQITYLTRLVFRTKGSSIQVAQAIGLRVFCRVVMERLPTPVQGVGFRFDCITLVRHRACR